MWKYQYSKMYRGVTVSDAWQLWLDVQSWHKWFKILTNSSVSVFLRPDNSFILQFQGEDPLLYTIVDIIKEESFVLKRKFLGAILLDKRSIEPTLDGVRLVRQLSLTGPLAFFWKHKIMKTIFYKSSIEFEYLATEARRIYYTDLIVLTDDKSKNKMMDSL